jgi:hypothetical protein
MHAAHMLYLTLAQFHQGVCENKRSRSLASRYHSVLPAEDALAEALALWKQDVARAPECGGKPMPEAKEEPALLKEPVSFAQVLSFGSRQALFVGSVVVAVEGDPCYDAALNDPEEETAVLRNGWHRSKLEEAAALINRELEARR